MINNSVPDAVKGHFIERFAPKAALPYIRLARLERPIGWWLLLLPCWWSLFLADKVAGTSPSFFYALLFLIGAIAMRGAGCTWNDIIDREIDAKVERTALRPLPSGQISVNKARVFGIALSLIGLAVLLQFNRFSVALGIGSLGVVLLYPFMKRITFWPQITLGLAFSWGALIGWAVIFGQLNAPALFLYAGSICWVIGYDTIYAHQDREDDAFLNIGSTARLFGESTKAALAAFYLATILLILTSFTLAGVGLYAYLGLAAFAIHLFWQVHKLDINSPDNCLMLFRSNKYAGLILVVALLLP